MVRDFRHAARVLRMNPGFTAMAVSSLALGIAVNTAIFSIFNGLFLASLPYPEPDRLVFLSVADTNRSSEMQISLDDADTFRGAGAFERIASFRIGGWSLSGFGESVRVSVAWTSYELGPVLGVRPILGRYFTPDECRGAGAKVALITYDTWQRLFAGSPDALGKIIHLDNDPFVVIGVLPMTAVYPAGVAVWFPVGENFGHATRWLEGVARLKPGVSIAQARAALVRAHRNAEAVHTANRYTEPRVSPLREHYLGSFLTLTQTLLAAVGFVLLIACLNVAGLILARAMGRSREAAIRSALGAGRSRLIRQLLAETLLLTAIGCAAGITLGWVALQAIIPLMPDSIPSWVTFRLDARFVWFTLGLMVVTAAAAGLWPAMEFAKADLRGALADAGAKASLSRARRRGLNLLVIGEVAVAVVLLSACGVVLQALHKVLNADPGFRLRNALTFAVNPAYHDEQNRRRYYRGIVEALEAAPGIDAVGETNMPPLSDAYGIERDSFAFRTEGWPRLRELEPVAGRRIVMPGYFRAMEIAFRAGRDFDEHDLQPLETPGVIINETLARRLWPPGTDPIGKRIAPEGFEGLMQVVGVVSDVRYGGLDREVEPCFYFCQVYPSTTQSTIHAYFVVRGTMSIASMTALARRAATRMDPGLAIYDVSTVQDLLDRAVAPRRAWSWLFAVFAALALILAAVGTYSVVSYALTQRTREIGIRVALGARPGQVAGDVLRGAMLVAGAGMAIGLGVSWFATRALTSLLAGLSPHDPIAYIAVVSILAVAVFVAAMGPARKAARVDPIRELREQ